MSSAAPAPQRWLFGPWADLLLGCGVLYMVWFVVLGFALDDVQRVLPAGLLPLVLLFTGAPHYGATLLRVYEQRESRRVYALFAVWATAALAALFVAGLHNLLLGSLLLTVYFTWSPWHYAGQNYGIALMFLRRRGVPISPAVKRLIYASFGLSFGLSFLAIHGAQPASDYAPLAAASGVYAFLPLGIPRAPLAAALVLVGGAYLLSLAGAAVALLRVARPADLVPSALLCLSQALWFAVPVIARSLGLFQGFGSLSIGGAAYVFLWIAVAHAIQYLWITTYYARHSDPDTSAGRYFAKALLAGAAIWMVPALVFAPGALGRLPYDMGLAALIASVVNLHHFVLDGAIWKLRDGAIARILLRNETAAAASAAGPPRRLRPALAVWAAGAVSVGVWIAGTVEEEFGTRRALDRDDATRVERSIERRAWIGRQSPDLLAQYGLLQLEKGDREAALREADAALALFPTANGWRVRGRLAAESGDAALAAAAYENALALGPEPDLRIELENNLAWLLATHPDERVRDARRAVELSERVAQPPRDREAWALDTLAAAYAADGRFDEALATANRARGFAVAARDTGLVRELDGRIAAYASRRPYLESGADARSIQVESIPLGGYSAEP